MRRVILLCVAIVVVAAIAGGVDYWWTVLRFVESTDDAYIQSDITIISPKVEGYVRSVKVRENEQVRAGEVLVHIDDRDYAAKLAQAEASLAAEEANLGTIDSQIELQQSLIAQADANMASADAEQHRSEADFKRYEDLMESKVASRQRYEQAAADAKKANAMLSGMHAGVAAAHNQLTVLKAQRRQQEAKVQQAKATRDLAQNDLDNTVIKAPVAGVVGNKGVQLGQYLRVGTQLMAIVPLPNVYVTANFKETQLTHMQPGQKVEISIDAFPDHPIEGIVESFAPGSGSQWSILPPENATGNFTKIVQRVPVRVAIPADNPLAGMLRPGLSVVATIDTRGEAQSSHVLVGIWGALTADAKAAVSRP
jgi:membrane fusion protein, multidrug efflux system